MPSTTTPLHPNPRVAKLLATGDSHKYASAAEWGRAHGITDKATMRTARQVLRDAGMGVGRGRTYTGQVGKLAVRASKANAKASAKAKAPAKAPRKRAAKASAKAQPAPAAQPQPQPAQG